jgi:hypothetical protein
LKNGVKIVFEMFSCMIYGIKTQLINNFCKSLGSTKKASGQAEAHQNERVGVLGLAGRCVKVHAGPIVNCSRSRA